MARLAGGAERSGLDSPGHRAWRRVGRRPRPRGAQILSRDFEGFGVWGVFGVSGLGV